MKTTYALLTTVRRRDSIPESRRRAFIFSYCDFRFLDRPTEINAELALTRSIVIRITAVIVLDSESSALAACE
jgi:hypothetical protein